MIALISTSVIRPIIDRVIGGNRPSMRLVVYYYFRPDGVSQYLRPDGVSLYERP